MREFANVRRLEGLINTATRPSVLTELGRTFSRDLIRQLPNGLKLGFAGLMGLGLTLVLPSSVKAWETDPRNLEGCEISHEIVERTIPQIEGEDSTVGTYRELITYCGDRVVGVMPVMIHPSSEAVESSD